MNIFNYKSSLFNDAAIYTFANLSVAGIPFLLLPILTRMLDPAGYGIVAMFLLSVSILSVFVGLNTHGSLTVRYFDTENFQLNDYIATIIVIVSVSTLLCLIIIHQFGQALEHITSISKEWLYIAVTVAACNFIIQILLVLWQAARKPLKYAALRIFNALMDGSLSIILVVILLNSWQGRLTAILSTSVVLAIIALFFLVREKWVSMNVDLKSARDSLSFGVPLVPHAIGGILLSLSDRVMVNNLLGTESVGIYISAVQFGLILGILVDSFNKAFAPWLMGQLPKIVPGTQKKIVLFSYFYFGFVMFLAVIFSLLSPYVIPFILGPDFQSASQLTVYIIFGNGFTGMYYMVTNYIFFSRKTWILSILTISTGLFTIFLTLILIAEVGLVGVAISFCIGQFILFVGAWIISYYCFPMPWLQVFKVAPE